MLNRLLAPLFLIFSLSSCEDSKVNSNVLLKVNPERPLVINADTVRTVVTIVDGVIVREAVTVPGPWTSIGFDFKNNNDDVITIIAVTIFATGPDGEVRESELFRTDSSGLQSNVFATIRPDQDINCDGFADDDEKALFSSADAGGLPAPSLNQPCSIDDINPSFTGRRALIEDLLQGASDEEKEGFRNATYQVKVRFEGWLGRPQDAPEKNFFKEIFFSATTN